MSDPIAVYTLVYQHARALTNKHTNIKHWRTWVFYFSQKIDTAHVICSVQGASSCQGEKAAGGNKTQVRPWRHFDVVISFAVMKDIPPGAAQQPTLSHLFRQHPFFLLRDPSHSCSVLSLSLPPSSFSLTQCFSFSSVFLSQSSPHIKCMLGCDAMWKSTIRLLIWQWRKKNRKIEKQHKAGRPRLWQNMSEK